MVRRGAIWAAWLVLVVVSGAPGAWARPLDETRLTLGAEGLARAARAFHEAKYGEAERLLDAHDDGSAEAAYLRALLRLEAGKAAEAERLLAGLAERLPALAHRIHWHLGAAREAQRDWEGALRAYEAVSEGSVLEEEARLGRARMLAELGRREEALAVLAPLAERPPPAWGVDRAAQALALVGETAEREAAVAAYKKLWIDHPQAPEAAEAERRLSRLGASKLSVEEEVRRAAKLIDVHQNEAGARILRKLDLASKLPDPLACHAELYLGRALRKMRHHSQAAPVLERVADRCQDEAIRAPALYLLATSTTIIDPPRGARNWRRLAAELPAHSYADDALFHAAEVDRRAGDVQGARETLHALIERYPDGDFRAEALFKLFWLERQEGRLEEGLLALFQLEGDLRERPRALYWQGRTLQDLGRPAEALAAYRILLLEHANTYYALLARGRLQSLDPALAVEMRPALPNLTAAGVQARALEGNPHFEAALALLRMGFGREATEELLRIDRAALREQGGDALAIVLLLDRAGSRQAAHQVARMELAQVLAQGFSAETALTYQLAYPLAYRDLVEENARRSKVPADLLQALMREESSLDPLVVSWAGAVGLTQLMPSTARSVAQRLGLGPVSIRRLQDPAFNVRVGTAYLGSLLQRWKGDYVLACASYNAGPGAVSRWLRERGSLPLDEFVEEIPIDQTRNYVKRVLDSFAAYRLIYGEGEARFPALMPGRADGGG